MTQGTLYASRAEVPQGTFFAEAYPLSHRRVCSPDDGSLMYVEKTHRVLDGVCFHLGDAPVLTSLYRSPAHNARVGGRPTSAHKKGIAFDLSWIGTQVDPLKLVLEMRRMGVNNIGLAKTFIHGDLRPGKDRFWWYKGAQDIWTREHGIRGRSDLGLAQ